MIGSQWQKWDLHIHTPESFVHNFSFENETDQIKYNKDLWEKYVDKLEEIKDISVIGITDYFSLNGYKKILEYRRKGRLKNFDLILPNIEFRLDIFAGREPKRLNYHIIFSDKLNTNIIEREFLQQLHIKAPNSENRSLSFESIQEIGKKLKHQHAEFRHKTDIIAGFDAITVNLQEIQEILTGKKSIFGGKYILVLSAPIWDEIRWDGQGHLARKTCFIDSHALFSSQKTTIEFCLGKQHLDAEKFLEEFGSLKPCIHGSDAHSFDKICKPDEDRYCWIKAIPIFDGLKQIIFEPEDRVRIQKENPEPYKNVYSLDSVEFFDSDINEGISIVPQKILFNKNFISITGGKGSGKTAILDLIANCYMNRCRKLDSDKNAFEDKNSFVQRIQDDTDRLGVSIEFIGDSIDPFSKRIKDFVFIEKSPITYLPQGKIEEISGDKKKLNEKIEEIVFNNEKVKEHGFQERFVEIKLNTMRISKHILELNNQIASLEEETEEGIYFKYNSEKQIALGKVADLKNQIENIESSLEAGIKDKILLLKKESKRIKSEKAKHNEVIQEINLLRGGIENFVASSNKTIEKINHAVCEIDVDLQIPLIDLKTQISAFDDINRTLNDKREKLTQDIEITEKSILELSGEEKTHNKLRKEVESIEADIKKIDTEILALDEKKNEILTLEEKRNTSYEKLLNTYLEWKRYYNEVISSFSSGKSEILGDIQFKSNILFDYEKFYTTALDMFNRKRTSADDIEKSSKNIEKTFDGFFNGQKTINDIKCLFENKSIKLNLIKKNRLRYEYYNWIFGNYFSLNTEIEFKGKSIDKLSMGQKGTVLLKLFLAEGDYPIILDQPEENLDNKFIYDELVGAMRNAKLNRQVLIATNNANLVVNTDAEQIIIAEYVNGKISYKSGAIESSDIREEIMPLLEGGQEAFKKREQKYGILGYQV